MTTLAHLGVGPNLACQCRCFTGRCAERRRRYRHVLNRRVPRRRGRALSGGRFLASWPKHASGTVSSLTPLSGTGDAAPGLSSRHSPSRRFYSSELSARVCLKCAESRSCAPIHRRCLALVRTTSGECRVRVRSKSSLGNRPLIVISVLLYQLLRLSARMYLASAQRVCRGRKCSMVVGNRCEDD
jgi:hypothetical protein